MNLLKQIEKKNSMHYKRIDKFIKSLDKNQIEEIAFQINRYLDFAKEINISEEEVIESYLGMVDSIFEEQFFFVRENRYRFSTLEEVADNVYHNEENMKAYMLGLALSQFLWENHYKMFCFLRENFSTQRERGRYLEIGVGHGLFFEAAVKSQKYSIYDLVDISKSSIELSKALVGEKKDKANWHHKDFLNFSSAIKYDFITMGEVLEHVERPKVMLKKLLELLDVKGKAYISTCANAPVTDHIYLFRSVDEIRNMLINTGFKIDKEFTISVDNIPKEKWISKRANITYAAIVSR